MRRPLVAGNWKLNHTLAKAESTVGTILHQAASVTRTDIVICPTFLAIGKVREMLRGSEIAVGAQDVFWVDSGAFTGHISVSLLADAGVTYCIVGHSETRGRFGKLDTPEWTVPFFGETDRTVNLKLQRLLFHGITPILCVGETLAEREAGQTDTVIQDQLKAALEGILADELNHFVVAYEPVWAIGTGKVCDTPEAERICAMIRASLAQIYDGELAERTRILYGGSVKASNAGELFAQPNIDGGLVGGASLDPEEFCSIVLSA